MQSCICRWGLVLRLEQLDDNKLYNGIQSHLALPILQLRHAWLHITITSAALYTLSAILLLCHALQPVQP